MAIEVCMLLFISVLATVLRNVEFSVCGCSGILDVFGESEVGVKG